MKRLIVILFVVAMALSSMATTFGPGEPPRPDCKWVEPTTEVIHHEAETHQEWVEAVTHTIVVVDVEAYDEIVVDVEGYTIEHPAVTHQECETTCPTYTWGLWYWKDGGWRHFGPITFTYDKSSDPNKCHRPTASSLGVPSYLTSSFNRAFDEWEDGTVTCVTVVDQEAWTETVPPVTHVVHHDAVTHEETIVDAEGYWVTVVDQEAYDETVVVTEGYWDCPRPPEQPKCELRQANYGLMELFGPNGEYDTMYIYPDANGDLPIGIGVDRQQCVLGWTAVRSGARDFVYRDTCTGDYFFNGFNVTPRPDVLKKGVCARNGACIR